MRKKNRPAHRHTMNSAKQRNDDDDDDNAPLRNPPPLHALTGGGGTITITTTTHKRTGAHRSAHEPTRSLITAHGACVCVFFSSTRVVVVVVVGRVGSNSLALQEMVVPQYKHAQQHRTIYAPNTRLVRRKPSGGGCETDLTVFNFLTDGA